MNQEIFRDLRTMFVAFYGDAASIRRILADAEIDAARIDFGGGALNIWHAVLTEARKTAQVEDLLNAVEPEYGKNADFRQVRDRYEQWKNEQGNPPTAGTTSNRTQVEAWQRQLASYRQNLVLIEERMSEYIEFTDIPLQLIKNKQQTEARIAELKSKLGIQAT